MRILFVCQVVTDVVYFALCAQNKCWTMKLINIKNRYVTVNVKYGDFVELRCLYIIGVKLGKLVNIYHIYRQLYKIPISYWGM